MEKQASLMPKCQIILMCSKNVYKAFKVTRVDLVLTFQHQHQQLDCLKTV